MSLSKTCAASVIALACASGAHAATFDLTGDDITMQRLVEVDGSVLSEVSTDATVSGAVEFDCNIVPEPCGFGSGGVLFSVDLTATQIIMAYDGAPNSSIGFSQFTGTDTFNGFNFTGLDFGMPITGVAVTGTETTGTPVVSFTANSVSIDMSGSGISGGGSFIFDISGTVAPVPLPAALPLAAGGLLALFGLGYRRKQRA
ncbi:hypothetical protein [Primorskyibacter sp. S187A]|uniref:hypothetical protein n=1 Tax=Primorskyibacter sp. S187A TaxID=3415130 RepID=UPI003C7EC6A5